MKERKNRPEGFKSLHDYGEAFKDDRKTLYQSISSFATVGTFTLLAAWIYITLLILEKVIGWF